jgi:hypothetical protein
MLVVVAALASYVAGVRAEKAGMHGDASGTKQA